MGSPDRSELREGVGAAAFGFDTIVVGAGSAGALLAARLSEDPSRSVCLIEAGEDPGVDLPEPLRVSSMIDERHDRWLWHHTARATDLRPDLPIPSGRVVGGSSAINTTVWLWALRADLDGWTAFGGSEWSYERCVPYFARIETDLDLPSPPHGTSGPIPVRRPPRADWSRAAVAYEASCIAAGYPACADHNAPDASGVGPVPFNTRDGLRMSAALAFLGPARSRPNLLIQARTTARRILTANGRAVGVEVEREGRREVFFGDEIVLSAGAIGSPQLLLLSGVGPAEELRRVGITPVVDRAGVGKNLRNHPLVATSWRVSESYADAAELPIPWQVQLRTTAPGSSDALDACLGVAVLTKRTPGHEPRLGVSALLMHAASSGELHLVSPDVHVQPAIDLRFLEADEDRARMRTMVELAIQLGARRELAPYRGALVQPKDAERTSTRAFDDWLRRNVLTSHHPCGTARMGMETDPLAVVDATGRVHGVDALRIVDASIMPDCPRVNVNATTMMLAEKISQAMRSPAGVEAAAGGAR